MLNHPSASGWPGIPFWYDWMRDFYKQQVFFWNIKLIFYVNVATHLAFWFSHFFVTKTLACNTMVKYNIIDLNIQSNLFFLVHRCPNNLMVTSPGQNHFGVVFHVIFSPWKLRNMSNIFQVAYFLWQRYIFIFNFCSKLHVFYPSIWLTTLTHSSASGSRILFSRDWERLTNNEIKILYFVKTCPPYTS